MEVSRFAGWQINTKMKIHILALLLVSIGMTCAQDSGIVTYPIGSSGGGAPTGSAGGDLSGTYPNPGVAKLNGQLPSYYLSWANETGTPTSAAGYGITNGATIDLWGAKAIPAGTVVGTSDSQTLTNKSISASQITGLLAIANGGTGTASPGIVAGTNIAVSGSWPNQTVATSGLAASATTDTTNATNISTGTLAAARVATLNQNTTGTSASAPTVSEAITQSNSFSVGNVIYFNGSSYVLAKSDAASTAEVTGIVSAATGSNFTVVYSGRINGLSGLTAGQVYFLSDSTAGLLTTTEPTTATHVSRPILDASSATSGIVLPFRGAVISAAAATPVVSVKTQTFSATGTYTPSTGMLYCEVELVGGGAGGGGCASSAATAASGGGGGGISGKNTAAGNNGTGFGSGGSGASQANNGGAAAGGNGTAGYLIVKEFCSQ